jgi:two-component system NtrC family response regulator
LNSGALTALKEHPWHGNLRELRNCMERLALTVPGPTITAEDVSALLHRRSARADDLPAIPLKDLERRAIIAALERFGGNRTWAAAALGIGRRTLQNKLKLYGMAAENEADEA